MSLNDRCNVECHYVECHYVEFHYVECHYVECHYVECHYVECHYAESRGVVNSFTCVIEKMFVLKKPLLFCDKCVLNPMIYLQGFLVQLASRRQVKTALPRIANARHVQQRILDTNVRKQQSHAATDV